MLPDRTVNGTPFDAPPAVLSTILPVVAAPPNCTVTLVSLHTGYDAAGPLPMATVPVPRVAPKLRP